MGVNNLFTSLTTNMAQRQLSRIISRIKKNHTNLKEIYSTRIKDNEYRKIVVLKDPITNIEAFNKIIDILSAFDLNDKFRQSTSTLVRAYNEDESAIIGYSTIEKNDYYFRVETNGRNISEWLEFIIYLSQNNISLEDIEAKEFVSLDSSIRNSDQKVHLLYPHRLKFFDNNDYMVNVKWFLNFLSKELCFSDYISTDKDTFEKNFFFSSKLLKIYIDVFFNNKKIEINYLRDVIKEEQIKKKSWRSLLYNPQKFYISPDESTIYFSTLEYNDFLKSGDIIYEEEEFYISHYNDGVYLIFKDFSDKTINFLKASADMISRFRESFYQKYGLKNLVYNTTLEHPIGILLDIDLNILKNRTYCPLENYIKNTNGKDIISIVKTIIELLEPLYKAGYSLDTGVKTKEILYIDGDAIFVKDILNARITNYDENKNMEEFGYSNISETIMNIFLRFVVYKIKKSKVMYQSCDNILFSFSPKVIKNFESFVVYNNYDIKEFYEGILETIKNFNKSNNKREFYSKYLVSPVDLPIKVVNENIIQEKNSALIVTNRQKVLNVIAQLFFIKKHIEDSNIKLYGLPRKVYYSEESSRFFAYEKNSECNKKHFCKLSEIKSILSSKSNKDIVKIIINLLKLRKSNFYVNFERLIYIDDNNDLCLLVDYLLGLKKIKFYNRNVKVWQQKLDALIIELLELVDFLYNKEMFNDEENEDKKIESLIFELQNFYDSLNVKCEKHNFWYSKNNFCKICNPNDILVDLDFLKNPNESNNFYFEYTYMYFGKEIVLRIFKNPQAEKTNFVKNLLDDMLYTKSKYYKKVFNIQNMDYIGYAYLYAKGIESFEINEIVDNKEILECIIGFIGFLKYLHSNSLTLNTDVVEDCIYFSNTNKVLVKDPFCIEENYDSKQLNNSILDFVRCYLIKSKSLDVQTIEQIISKLKNNDYERAKIMIKDIINSFNSFCKIHLYHFSNKIHSFCPECFERNIVTYPLKDVENCKIFSENGKEAIIYDIGKGLLAKVYRKKEDGSFIDEIDIDKKQEIASKLLKMPVLKNTLKLGYNFEIVAIEGIILDEDGNFCGIVMKKKINTKSVKVLTDRAHISKLNISREDILSILISVGKAIEFCHENGMYIGDISYNNILFDPASKTVYIIDLDSINFGTKDKTVFTEQFVDPLSITRKGYSKPSDKADWYAFATLAFYILTLLHPFNGIYLDSDNKPMSLVKRKVNKISVLGNHNIKIPPIALSWEWMSNSLKSAFLDIFEKEKRYNITDDLIHELNSMQKFSEESIKKAANNQNPIEIKVKESISDLNLTLVREDSNYILLSKYVKYPWNNGSMSITELENFKKKFYICDNKIVYSLAHFDDIRCYFSNTLDYDNFVSINVNDIIDDESAKIYMSNAGMAISYTNVFLCIVSDDNRHYLVKCEFIKDEQDVTCSSINTDVIGEYDYLPNINLSINTKNGNNDINDLTHQYQEILKFISENYNNTNTVFVYFDAITNKWLLMPYGEDISSAYIIDVKDNFKNDKINLPYEFLENNSVHLGNIIFFNDAIYYPSEQKICSINLKNYNYIEFLCEDISEDSIIEIIKKGFRIYNLHHVYDLIKEDDDINNGTN